MTTVGFALCCSLLHAAASADATTLPTWPAFEAEHRLKCQATFDTRTQRVERKIGAHRFRLEGSRLVRQGPARGRLKLGVLSAIKDLEEGTQANLDRAFAAFSAAGVDAVISNGDLALDEFALEEVMNALGDSGLPVLVLIGNSESRAAFNRAFMAAEAKHPNLFNLNWVRHVDLGAAHLVSLPGYHDKGFMAQRSGCRYRTRDVAAIGNFLDGLDTRGAPVVMVGHGPPRSRGKQGIDRAHNAGNVGDPDLADLITAHDVRFGLFGHILEAGGRATSDLPRGKPARQRKRSARLYVNAGSASATPWGMLGGEAAEGLAMIVELDAKGGSYRVLDLKP